LDFFTEYFLLKRLKGMDLHVDQELFRVWQ